MSESTGHDDWMLKGLWILSPMALFLASAALTGPEKAGDRTVSSLLLHYSARNLLNSPTRS